MGRKKRRRRRRRRKKRRRWALEGMAPTAKRRRLADTPVARLQPEGVLRYQSVPPILPPTINFMGGVDRTSVGEHTGLIGNLNVTSYAFSFNSLIMLSTMPICSTSTVFMLTN